MKTARLTDFGIPQPFVDRWTETIGPELLDWQADAVRHFDLLGSGNLIAIAPTSSGKTVLGELAATAALMRRRKVVYVAPLKALVAQKYERFSNVFAPLGFRVAMSTRDRRIDDRRIRRGDFDVAVTVYEKWHALLLTHLDVLTAVHLLILDEPQLIADPKRGPTVAAILDAVAAMRGDPAITAPRVVMLTARLPQAPVLADYLGAPIQTVHRRPVELRLGVLTDGCYRFRECNSTDTGTETFPWDDQLPEHERPLALLDALADHGEQILIFCSSKTSCHRRAQALSDRRPPARSLTDDERWRLQSGPSLAPRLAHWLSHGVGVHHADLTPHQRALVESLFSSGDVPVVFCTGTLAWGVNLPATIVFVDAEKYTGGPYNGQPIPTPLGRLEFEGMAGRAGRLGLSMKESNTIGRGILWSRTACEAELLWNAYVKPAPMTDVHTDASAYSPTDNDAAFAPMIPSTVEGLAKAGVPPLPAFAPARRLLDWIVTGLVTTLGDACDLAQRSPFGNHDSSAWEPACERLIDTELIRRDPDGHLHATPRGSITATAGMTIDSAVTIVRALEACSDFDPATWTALFTTLTETSDARLRSGTMTPEHRHAIAAFWRDRFGDEFTATLHAHFANDPLAVTIQFPNSAVQTYAMLTALVLDDWAEGTPTCDLECRFQLPIGRLAPVADTISWMTDTTALLAKTAGSTGRLVSDLQRTAFAIRHGIPYGAQALVGALEGLLPRQVLLDLITDGWNDPAVLAERRPAELSGYAPASVIDQVLKRCRAWMAREHDKSHANVKTNTPETKGEQPMSPILHLDGAANRARLAVQLAGRTLMLRAKSFKYLLALATARVVSRDGWIAKGDIEPGENQIKYLYQLRRELRNAPVPGGAEGLIENDGRGNYRLTLPPQAIKFDLERLLEHTDWDIRTRAEQLASAKAATAA